jgi:branched-chain amino acid transport system substrate-binding protein
MTALHHPGRRRWPGAALFIVLWALLTSTTTGTAFTQGVTAREVVIGTLQDLSGPLAPLGMHLRNGMQMRLDEANARGGVHGRKLRLVVEDTGYDPRKAVLATDRLLQQDKVFAVIGNLGSVVVNATLPTFLDAGVPHLFPAAPQLNTYQPFHPLKFALAPAYSVSTPAAARALIRQHGYTRIGVLYQDDDYGQEVLRGMAEMASDLKQPLCEKAAYRRGATDFAAPVARLKAAGCDFVVLGTVVRETIGAVSEARKQGWNVPMLVTVAGYTAQVPQLGGATMNGLYGVVAVPHPYAENASPALAKWIAAYRQRFGQEPNTWAVLGYSSTELLVRSIERAGPNLSVPGLVAALETLDSAPDAFGSPAYRFSAGDHLATREVRLAQVRNGRWELLGHAAAR